MHKIYLFKPVSLFGRIISFVTRSPYSHSAVEIDGVIYDSSEKRGSFGIANINLSDRFHIEFEVEGDLSGWLKRMEGTQYDWVGIFGWFFKFNDYTRFYCFEATYEALVEINVTERKVLPRIDGNTIKAILVSYSTE